MGLGRNVDEGTVSPSGSMTPLAETFRDERATRTVLGGRRASRRACAQLASVVIGIGVITWYVQFRHDNTLSRQSPLPAPAEALPDQPVVDEPDARPAAAAPPVETQRDQSVQVTPAPPQLDPAAVADGEAALDAASRDRARADDRAARLARRLSQLTGQAALDAAQARKLVLLVRDPSTRITQAAARGGFLRGERVKLEKELTSLRQLPRPKLTSILSKSPVARPADGNEYHFELHRNRIAFIDLERLLTLTKADAQVRIRMTDRVPSISGKVGPVGAFSLEYELLRSVPGSVEEMLERKSYFNFRAWELVPESETRGETYESTRNPLSEFSRAVNRITPGRATITLWVYPDSFTLHRRIRNDLIERGFSVAARPLPDGMTIRGSPMGTQSAAQ